MKNIKNIALFIISLSTVSCKVTQDYQSTVNTDPRTVIRDELALDTVGASHFTVANFFRDTILKQHIRQALIHNYDIKSAKNNLIIAERKYGVSRFNRLPEIDAGVNISSQKGSETGLFGEFFEEPIQQYSAFASVSWEADLWGKLKSIEKAYHANYRKEVALRDQLHLQIIYQLAVSYYRIISLDLNLKLLDKYLKLRKEEIKQLSRMIELGQTNKLQLDILMSRLYFFERQAQEIEKDIFLEENKMSILLGKQPDSVLRSVSEFKVLHKNTANQIPLEIIRNRPDVRASEYNLIESFELYNVAATQLYPSLRLNASGGFESIAVEEWFNTASIFGNIVGGLTQPIFHQKKLRSEKEIANIRKENALNLFEKSVLEAGQEISDALYSCQATRNILQTHEKEVLSLQDALSSAEVLHNYNEVNILDVYAIRKNLIESELELVQSKLSYTIATIKLFKSAGIVNIQDVDTEL